MVEARFYSIESWYSNKRKNKLSINWKLIDIYFISPQVKVDAKTKTLLDEYRKKKKAKELGSNGNQDKSKEAEKDKDADSKENGDKSDKGDKEEGEESASEGGEEVDENSKREDRVAQAGLEAIMREYAFELAKEPPAPKACGYLVCDQVLCCLFFRHIL